MVLGWRVLRIMMWERMINLSEVSWGGGGAGLHVEVFGDSFDGEDALKTGVSVVIAGAERDEVPVEQLLELHDSRDHLLADVLWHLGNRERDLVQNVADAVEQALAFLSVSFGLLELFERDEQRRLQLGEDTFKIATGCHINATKRVLSLALGRCQHVLAVLVNDVLGSRVVDVKMVGRLRDRAVRVSHVRDHRLPRLVIHVPILAAGGVELRPPS